MTVLTEAAPFTGMDVPMVFTDSAASKVRELIEEEGNDDLKLRVFVAGGGCSGFKYGFTFDEQISEDDTVMENAEGAQFIIKNPGAASTCGCGSSFSV